MNIVYLSDEVHQMVDLAETVGKIKGVDKVVPFSPPLTQEQCSEIVNRKEDLFIVVAGNPQHSSSERHSFFPVELANMGTNPGHVGFVDLNHIFLASADGVSAANRLQIHVRLTLVKLDHSKENPRVDTVPLKKLFIVGEPAEETFVEKLQKAGVELCGIWTGKPFDLTGHPAGLSGMPGQYTVTLQNVDESLESIQVGGMVVFNDGLSEQQKQYLLDGFLFSSKDKQTYIQPSHLRLSQAMKVVHSEQESRRASDFFVRFLDLSNVSHFVEDPHIDHEKCGLCGTCVKTCMFHASKLNYTKEETGVAEIYPNHCIACGNCVTACPTQARDLPAYPRDFFSSAWKELKTFQAGTDGLKILVIYCEANGHNAIAHLADNGSSVPSSCLFLRIRCGGMVDTQFIPDSFQAGFDGVAILVCARDECNNSVGSLDMERRLNLYRKVMQVTGMETGRMRIIPVHSGKFETVGDSLQQFADFLDGIKQDRKMFGTMTS